MIETDTHSRAASTLQITWENVTLSGRNAPKPIFKEVRPPGPSPGAST